MSSDFFPNNSEVAFLSLVLKHPELMHDSSSVKIGMFTSTQSQIIFSAIQELSSQGLVPEELFLTDFLSSHNRLSLAGGEAHIKYLFEQDFSIDNFSKYREMLIDAYRSRSIISAVSDVPSRLTSGDNVDRVIFDLKSEIDSLDGDNVGKATFRLSESIQEVWAEIVSRTANPGLTGITTGYKSLDVFTGGYPLGDFWIFGARPSQGKSSLVCNSAVRSALNGGVPLLFSLEMNRQTLVERLIATVSKVELSSIRLGTLNQEELDSVHDSLAILKELPLFLDTNFSTNINYATSIIRKYVKNSGVNVVWIDYVQLMSERGDDQTAELGRISRAMKLLAKDLNIFIGLTAQLNRLVEMRDDKRPILSDLRQSGNLEEDADLVAFLYRDEYYYADSKNKGVLEFIIRKNRNGPVGIIPMKFEKETTIITD